MSAHPDGTVDASQVPTRPEAGPDPIVAIGRTVSEAAGTMVELHEVFDRLRELLVLAREEHDNEVKIGELFVRAQDHVNRAVADAEERTRQLLADAELEASRIVTAAEREARRLLEEARQPVVDPSVTEQLQRTIDGFTRVNKELQSELTALVRSLTASAQTPSNGAKLDPNPPAFAGPVAGSVSNQGRNGALTPIAPPPRVAPSPPRPMGVDPS